MRTFFTLMLGLSFLSGCSTMYFVQGKQPQTVLDHEEWHHDGVLGLIEFSPPVNLYDRCEGDSWKTVKIEKSFLNGLAEAAVNSVFVVPVVTTQVSSGAGAVTVTQYRSLPLYDPWMVSYSCR